MEPIATPELAARPTHEVVNQSTALSGHNLYADDLALRDALRIVGKAMAGEGVGP